MTDVEIPSWSLAGYYSSHAGSRSGGVKQKFASNGVQKGDKGKLCSRLASVSYANESRLACFPLNVRGSRGSRMWHYILFNATRPKLLTIRTASWGKALTMASIPVITP